ncbi:MAG: XdhC/CoxI family protein [Synergistales bacterium]|nr:XdhC/CoxI family protein [Synergistales bacterium]MDY6402139.1 XdhC/CoxI family protein [Synergistales bacterium]MDY6404275.1 XdhC/CoxI family protein [Synergistales bacterium]MDY6409811.1 XdhC/CoxI family protein [Synergistales bacterium]MDY6414229.1 XdhC/CoxI family protein [Synergistales bacterium]
MNTKFFEIIKNSNPNKENISFTVIKGKGLGEKAIFSDGECIFFSDYKGFLKSNFNLLAKFHNTGIYTVENSLIYAEKISTEKKIIICGAGHVSMPIVKFAKILGFHVTVIDDREIFIENALKNGADVIICEPFESALSKIPGGFNSYFVIVTRGHRYDSECLRSILKKTYAYVGMMGSIRRVKIVRESLLNEGFDAGAVLGIHSPIGLAINAETPEEIAISIFAEIIQIKNKNRDFEFSSEILDDILAAGHHETLPGRKVLCTIVSKQGAGPRNVGTKMLCTSEGKILGTIGGGLMEAQVIKKAGELFSQENFSPVLVKFNLTAGELSEEGEVCGGIIEIFIESVS